jgi:hypothetical protein
VRLSTLCTRVVAGLAGLATATALAAPLAAQACDDAPSPHRLGYADLAHSSELTAAGVPRSDRLLQRGTGLLEDNPGYSLAGLDQPLALLLPDEHGTVFWQDAQTSDHVTASLGQELTEAYSDAAAHEIGMALYEQVKARSGHARHAIPVDGGSLTWFHEDDQGPGATISVIRMGRRVSVVVVSADVPHQHRLLLQIADRMR